MHWSTKRDASGYWTTRDGRWKAAEYQAKGEAPAITLTDTTRRAVFADTGKAWTRLPTWESVREVIAAHAAFADASTR